MKILIKRFFSKPHLKKAGVTLLELLILIVVVSIALVPLYALFNQALNNHVSAQIMTVSAYLGQYVMESILAKSFFELQSDLTSAEQFYGNTTPFGAPFEHYFYTLRVDAIDPAYIGDLSDIGARVSASGVPLVGGNYLRIYVKISNDTLPPKYLELWNILTPAKEQGY